MSRLCDEDRRIIAVWREHGIPDDQSTREFAVRVIGKLVDDLDEMHDVVDQLFAEEPRLFVVTERKSTEAEASCDGNGRVEVKGASDG